jgi:hypothetical protein
VPGGQFYERTKINEAAGETCFRCRALSGPCPMRPRPAVDDPTAALTVGKGAPNVSSKPPGEARPRSRRFRDGAGLDWVCHARECCGDPSAAFEGHARCLTLPAGYSGHGSSAIWHTSAWVWTGPAVFARNQKRGIRHEQL